MKHQIKIWPQYYKPVADGLKTFEIRNNDRGYQAGDCVEMRCFDPKIKTKQCSLTGKFFREEAGYTDDQPLIFKIGYVLPVDAERVVFSLIKIETAQSEEKSKE